MSRLIVKKTNSRFSLPVFILTVSLSLVGFLLALALLAPSVWNVQLAASFWTLVGVFLVAHLMNAFVEYFFHRYVLHASLIPGLGYFHQQHTIHHGLTKVTWKVVVGGTAQEELHAVNRYPIVEPAQHWASFFPWYTFLVFGILGTPLFILGQWLFPDMPIFLASLLALAWSLTLYEILHAFEHRPLEFWTPRLHDPLWGWFWRKFYAFHLRHHADILSNESISGFFGSPVADWCFGTYVGVVDLYEDGTVTRKESFISPSPRFIGWLDRLAERSKRS
ncbi:MAG: hypothetical protein Q7R62_02245 [bacterium]|nr:hypothetical protein [bacterium]